MKKRPPSESGDAQVVAHIAARLFKVYRVDLLAPTRTEKVSAARQLSMYALITQYKWTATRAAAAFNRTHGAALNAQRVVVARVQTEPKFNSIVATFLNELGQARKKQPKPHHKPSNNERNI